KSYFMFYQYNNLTDKIIHIKPCDNHLYNRQPRTYRSESGRAFNWKMLKKHNIPMDKLILAGGLSIDNIYDAKTSVNPAGVDVSSGVETAGVKDPVKIKQFISLAKKDG